MSERNHIPKLGAYDPSYMKCPRACEYTDRDWEPRKGHDCLTGRGVPLGMVKVLKLDANELNTSQKSGLRSSLVQEGWFVKSPGFKLHHGGGGGNYM